MGWAGPLFDGHVCSIGYEVIDWIVNYTCHGVGDIQGEPWAGAYDMDDEIRAFIIDAYRINPETGRRHYNEAVLSRAKGRAKSEIAAAIVCAEALGPVRFSHWDDGGQPVGRRVRSPLIKCLATEESQAGNTFASVAVMFQHGAENFPEIYGNSVNFLRYQSATQIHLPGGGEIRASTSGAASKDGGLETFVVADETHLYVLPELRRMYATISRNLGKRKDADSWLMQTSTAYAPGENSVFETTLTLWRKGQLPPTVLVDHREGKGKVDLEDKARTMRQLRQAYGAASEWIDLERKYRDMRDPRICKDQEEAARYFLNRPLSSRDVFIARDVIEKQAATAKNGTTGLELLPERTPITIGFDGSLNDDSTVLVGCRLSDGWLWPIGIWEKPEGAAGLAWEVPRAEVVEMIRATYKRYRVRRGYFDPHEWRSEIDSLAGEFGETSVLRWETSSWKRMSAALDGLRTDLLSGAATHSGDPVMMEQWANAYKSKRGTLTLVRKENAQSSRKIDSLVGATLAYEARRDVLIEGTTRGKQTSQTFFSFA